MAPAEHSEYACAMLIKNIFRGVDSRWLPGAILLGTMAFAGCVVEPVGGVVVAPRPVYVEPRPVVVVPAPVYVAPQPVYVAPRPVYVAPVYVQPIYRR